MKLAAFSLSLLLGLSSLARGAVSLTDAYALWEFNYATSGAATASQVTGRAGTNTVVASDVYNLSWTSAPSAATYGGVTIERALQFSPVVVTYNPGPGTSGTHEDNDVIKGAGFRVGNATLAGDMSLMTRLRWDGPPAGSDDRPGYYWFVNNGHGADKGSMFGVDHNGYLMYYHRAVASGETGYPGTGVGYTFTSNIKLEIGEWYDIGMVLDSLGDTDPKTGNVTFYAASVLNGFQKHSSANNLWVSTQANSTTLIVGSEALSANGDNNNSRKTLYGALDYLAFFDQTFTEGEIHAFFAVPEPSRAVLALAGFGLLFFRRSRQGD